MKKVLLLLVFFAVFGGLVFAEADLTTFPPGIGSGPLMNIGVGFGNNWGYKIRVPPIVFALDFPFRAINDLPFTLGIGAGFAMHTWDYGYSYYYSNSKYTRMSFAINGRFAYHFNVGVENLDLYPFIALGARLWLEKYDYNSSSVKNRSDFYGRFDFGIGAGIRYYFTNSIGVFGEFGYTGLTWASAGLAIKF